MIKYQFKYFTGMAAALFVFLLFAGCKSKEKSDDLLLSLMVGGGTHAMNSDALEVVSRSDSSSTTTVSGKIVSMTTPGAGSHIIQNGTVQMGVNKQGHLNVGGGTRSTGRYGTYNVGLRYMETNSEATAPGCLCEGWGVGDAISGKSGNASVHTGGVKNVSVEDFKSDGVSATSVVTVDGIYRVTHDYHPSSETPNLYEVTVTIENISSKTVELLYTRGMDWDISPNTFSEYVTIQGTADAENVKWASDNGFLNVNPFASRYRRWAEGDFVDSGPTDHGAHFDFDFGKLNAGETKTFNIYYGAAGTEEDALTALSSVQAEVYSFGQANWSGTGDFKSPLGASKGTYGKTTGEPHTFIFGFSGVGGKAVKNQKVAADAGEDISVRECSLKGANLTLSGSGSADKPFTFYWEAAGVAFDFPSIASPTGLFPVGINMATLTVTDADGLKDSDDVKVTVIRPPYDIDFKGSTTLWPPNNKYHTISGFTEPECPVVDVPDINVRAFITSNEPDDTTRIGDAHHTADIRVTRADGTVITSSNENPTVEYNPYTDKLELRAERAGTKNERIYTINMNILEYDKLSYTKVVHIKVPHDQ